jgi:hypothetical protein
MKHNLDDGTELINPMDGTPYTEDQRFGFFTGLQQVIDTQYQRDREHQYPTLSNQLDMLWHELKTSGSISDSGDWFNIIKEIKDNHPKPNN